jgi:pimeloyl-ACP methyl ester carboxylesterase
LSEIQQETLLLWGKYDRILGIEAAQLFDRDLPNSQLKWIDNCGHVPHLEMALTTAEYILDFVSK